MPKDEALRQAKLRYLKAGRWKNACSAILGRDCNNGRYFASNDSATKLTTEKLLIAGFILILIGLGIFYDQKT